MLLLHGSYPSTVVQQISQTPSFSIFPLNLLPLVHSTSLLSFQLEVFTFCTPIQGSCYSLLILHIQC
jgi:hypothetical protein